MNTHLLSMPSRPICLQIEEEVKEKEEEEAEARIEVEGTALHIHKEGATVKVRAMAKATASKVDINTNMLKDKGMTNPMSSVIIARNMGIMPMSVGKRNMT